MAALASNYCNDAFWWRHDPRNVRKTHKGGSTSNGVWSGTRKLRPSKPTMEPISPSACLWARRNTARNVSAVRMASGDYRDCPPRVVRGSAAHAAIASSVNQTAKLPRWRRPAS